MRLVTIASALALLAAQAFAQQPPAAPSSTEELYLERETHHEVHPRLHIQLPSDELG